LAATGLNTKRSTPSHAPLYEGVAVNWYKRFPTDFLEGVALLTLEEIGAYAVLLDTLYARGGTIPDNHQALSCIWKCNARKARRLKMKLLVAGKIQTESGHLTNRRVQIELNKAKTKSLLAQSSAQKRWSNNGRPYANADAILDTRDKKERGNSINALATKYPNPPSVSPELKHRVRGRGWR
jgi:uncharacterized protein YdaU (DUF1376 family)